jgi:hypothetical protein
MFTDAKDIETHLVREFDFLQKIADAIGFANLAALGGIEARFHETIDAQLNASVFAHRNEFIHGCFVVKNEVTPSDLSAVIRWR